MNPRMLRVVMIGLGALSLTACQNLNADNLSAEDVTDLGDAFNREAEVSVIGMSLSETVLVVGADAPTTQVQAASSAARVQALPACVTIVAGSETDSDGDGVPDDVTLQFNCSRNLTLNRTHTLTGQVRLQDVKPSLKDGSYRETSIDLKFAEERNGNPTFSETRNGTRSLVLLGGQSLTRENDMNFRFSRPVLPDVRLLHQMRFAFTATSGTVALNQPLPAGTLEVTGSLQMARGLQALRGFTVTTESPLQYDPSCTEQRLVGGSVVLRSAQGAVRVTFQACGSNPTATQIP